MFLTACPCAILADDTMPSGAGNGMMPFAPVSAASVSRDSGYGIVPGAPSKPTQSIRPESWPGGSDASAGAADTRPLNASTYPAPTYYPPYPAPNNYPPPAAGQYPNPAASPATGYSPMPPAGALGGPMQPQPAPSADAVPCESAQVLARVGNDVVLTSDVIAGIDDLIARNKDKIPADQVEAQRKQVVQEVTAGIQQLLAHINEPNPGAQVDPQRRAIIQQLLRQQIETKLIYQDFRRTVPTEGLPNIEQALTRQFDQTELKKLFSRENVQSRPDLEWKLRARGSSLDREKRMFMERVVSQQWIQEQIKFDKEVTHEQMLSWYQAHLVQFEKPARARWEELMASSSQYRSNEEAYAAVAQMGNQVLSGAPLAEVAKAQSAGPTAAKGGLRDWTTKGALTSEQVDRALFGLPVGQLSPILEGKTGYHIIRVIERQEPTRTPFLEAQKEVGEKIRQERTRKQYAEYVARVRKQFPVWTIFDDASKKVKPEDGEEPSRY